MLKENSSTLNVSGGDVKGIVQTNNGQVTIIYNQIYSTDSSPESDTSYSGESSTAYLFVSYASQDRGRVLPLIEHLLTIGLKFWIDENQIADRLDNTQEASSAIQRSSGVVVFISPHTLVARNVRNELNFAIKRRKRIILLILEKMESYESFLQEIVAEQVVEIYNMTEQQWIQEVRTVLSNWGLNFDVITSKSEPNHMRKESTAIVDGELAASPLVPYLVNRLQQERELRDAFTTHTQQNSRRPLLLLVYGGTEQAMHEYIERIEKASLPRILRRLGLIDVIKWVNLPWVRSRDWQQHLEQTISYLREDVEAYFDLRPGTWPEGIAQVSFSLRSTIVFCYRLNWNDWIDTHIDTLSAWALEWSKFPDLPFANPIVILFAVEYVPAKPGILQRLFRKSQTDDLIQLQLRRLLTMNDRGLGVSLLSELGNITVQDVEHWILEIVKPPDPAAMIRLAREVLKDPTLFTESGVPMNRLARYLADLIAETGRRIQ